MTAQQGCTIIAISNSKGGVAKTTTAVSLAHGLATRLSQNGGGRVLLVDLDPQGNVGNALRLALSPKAKTLADMLLEFLIAEPDGDRLRELLGQVLVEGGDAERPRPGLFVLPSSRKLAKVKAKVIALSAVNGDSMAIENIFEATLGKLRSAFKYIVLDCPPTLDIFDRAVYRFADKIIMPVKVDFLGEVGTAQKTEDIAEAKRDGLGVELAYVLPTFVDVRQVLAKQVLVTLVKHFGRDKIASPIPRSVLLEQAPATGQTILEYAPDSPAAAAYWKLVDKIIQDGEQ